VEESKGGEVSVPYRIDIAIEAIERAKDLQPDPILILLDLGPRLNGAVATASAALIRRTVKRESSVNVNGQFEGRK
jgi:hypothetical protein